MNLNELFPLIYCINLDKREDRYEQAKKELDKVEIKFERFSAIEDKNPIVGCWKSHIDILEQALSLQENVFIFEDDVQFIENSSSIEKSLKDLVYRVWTMFYLGGNILRPFYQVSSSLGRLSHCQSTHAYGMTWNMISTILPIIKKYRGSPLDVIYADIIVPNVQAYISIPMIAIQRDSYSDIEEQKMTYEIPVRRYKKYLVEK
jgi:GR25 family glycosyltransferase involved in LPS biosynthesis